MGASNIHLFEYLENKYVYDVNKSAILLISDEAHFQLEHEQSCDEEAADLEEIKRLRQKGYLSPNRPKAIKHPKTSMVEHLLDRNLQRLCLQVTQSCNFRCSYCVYSDIYTHRSHTVQKMDWETAKKSMDFLIEHSQDSLSIGLGFYGGEPLLQYELIKKCMDYMAANVNGKMLSFNLTTNASLLNEEMVQQFLKYNTKITISLDGPQEIQDANRTFANGKGTYDIVTGRIRNLCKKYPSLKENLNYSMVFDPQNSFSCIDNFVNYDEELFDGTSVMGSMVTGYYRKDNLKYTEDFLSEWEYSKFTYMLHLIGKLSEKYDSKIMKMPFLDIISIMKTTREKFSPLGDTEHHSGPCVPGQLRLFVNAKGEFYPCEKVSENSKVMNIGSLDRGFDYEKVKQLLNVGQLTEKECKDCFAIRNCGLCAMTADTGEDEENTLSRELKLSACRNMRAQFEDKLKDICALKRCGFNLEQFQVQGGKYAAR
ncbi:Cys-rich peptide radical SAM maturase CcpM [Paenibacillus macerans]|uniref:Cys-rich peptide radical SAM maturase CcpM n=1 Tax=Paenibacillus macerans TaxID=44252 RepID=A0A090Y6L5_PAEMA|nr:Cys-rich peptide radical SAM maturase CcpM [Paenibacillus macerans]KFM93472.1 Cys-rich peptide radical SAM maturase CcpM [Paenibacillus macerans]MBS5911013.1 Cys-rich peptide radical SAM maturase CcpM [Paenibacillus macerans]MCY7556981.1 Cys-rich peptide radical SAM maturase CcpM [Paenibacillus macerans]MEC0137842.1 Cys-rich peptide radical SAM maturase CcpM [Paenibacillus macerans]MEC0154326.1 Cys-rich peptide radical SAM maturase CcpM [Paenibacillus macerans]